MFLRKFTFGILKFKFQNGLKQKNFKFWIFFETNGPVEAKPPKKCGNTIADSETCKQYRDFDT